MNGKMTVVLVLALWLLGSAAWAYGDPGSGALLWQMAGAFLIGAMFYVRRIVFWVGARLGRKPSSKPSED